MKLKILKFYVLVFVIFVALGNAVNAQPKDTTKLKDTTNIKKKSDTINVGTNNSLQTTDSQDNSLIKYDERIKKLETDVSILNAQKSELDDLKMIGAGCILAILILCIAALIITNKKISKLKDSLNSKKENKENHNFDDFRRNVIENNKKVSDNYESAKNSFEKIKEELSLLRNDLSDLQIKYNAVSGLSNSVASKEKTEQSNVDRIISETVTEAKSKIYIVEYFVDDGTIKFKETNSGSPFYIESFEDRDELTINESSYASDTYAESIKKCFNVRGDMTGRYKNVKPALCSKDGDLTWKLEDKGILESNYN